MEVLSKGGSGTTNASIPSPTGNGYLLDSTLFEGNYFPAGNWSAVLKMNDTGGFASIDMIVRFYKRSSGGTYTSIGSTTLTAQSMSSTTTTYTLPNASLGQVAFTTGDKLYVDCFLHPQASDGHWTGDPIVNFSSSSSTAGIANQFQINTPGYLSTTNTKSVGARTRLAVQVTKSVGARTRLAVQVTKSVGARLRLIVGTLATKSVGARTRLAVTNTKSVGSRTRLSVRSTKSVGVRLFLVHLVTKTLGARTRLSVTKSKTVGVRARIVGQGQKTLGVRLPLLTGIASGGATVWANGTGTATIDHFRWTQYPDPSLCLAPIIPRCGATGVPWNALVPGNTTLGVDISLDGVTWTDVSSSNGGSLPGIFSQKDPITDGFSTNTAANYTSTFRTGGAAAAWTYDTANSRLVATGGTNALYLYTAISRADVDMFADLDRADAGGLVWRYNDQSNFYYLLIADNATSSGTPNTITLYKVASNVQTQLATAPILLTGTPLATFIRSTFHRFRITMLAGVITAYVDGVQHLQYTDSSPLGAGKMGLFTNGGVTGSRYYQVWMTQIGDYVTGTPSGDIVTSTFVYSRLRLATTDPTETPQVEDITTYAFTPQISAGVTIPSVNYTAASISKNYDDLARQSNFYWYIDTNKALNFRLLQSVPAPWILQSAPAGLVNDVDLLAPANTSRGNNFELDVSNDLYRNRQIILGAQDTLTPPPAIFAGDGNTRSFTVGYPLYSIPTITLNGITQTVGGKGSTGFAWYWAYNDPVLEQDTSGAVLQATDQLSVTYTGLVDAFIQVDDTAEQIARAAIEGGTGIVEAVEDHSADVPQPLKDAAITLAQQLIERYAITGRTLIFDTTRNGLAVGQMLSIYLQEHGIWDGQFLITQIEITLQKGINDTQVWWYKVTASELPRQASWAKLIASGLGLK
jgi:hypothetical protein